MVSSASGSQVSPTSIDAIAGSSYCRPTVRASAFASIEDPFHGAVIIGVALNASAYGRPWVGRAVKVGSISMAYVVMRRNNSMGAIRGQDDLVSSSILGNVSDSGLNTRGCGCMALQRCPSDFTAQPLSLTCVACLRGFALAPLARLAVVVSSYLALHAVFEILVSRQRDLRWKSSM